jgi:hypothetical protein
MHPIPHKPRAAVDQMRECDDSLEALVLNGWRPYIMVPARAFATSQKEKI